ncbi:MAG: hypothetical protein LBE81_09815 [Azonexus sp.]|jgi:hypothetical protein|uniref:hypothetical protein n=1 Tax=Azonexus sp. TaxID=1872668 RepID=UPI0028253AE4|nr:hypothetical protein [Azonexus sp.]MDR0776915.1 hypothetical protein [Azonexus sp.]
MNYPAFFDQLPVITLYDPLAEFLGASEGGVLEYRYLDAVKLAGHSCPTVAAAWNMSRLALAALYEAELPCRGDIWVELRGRHDEGVTGVVANIVSLLTGAAGEGGFKGLGGRFQRQGLLQFAAAVPRELRFTRLDSGRWVDIACNTSVIPADPVMLQLLQQCLSGAADATVRRRFGELWQARVRCLLLEHGDDPEVFALSIGNRDS